MSNWINWSCSRYGNMEYGQMPIRTISTTISKFSEKALEFMNKNNVDHVIYAAKEYNDSGDLAMVRFYEGLGMDDETFEKRINDYHGIIYAIHNRNKKIK